MGRDSKLWEIAWESYKRQKKYWEFNSKHPKKQKSKVKRRKKIQRAKNYKTRPYTLYALRLEHGCYYVGITKNLTWRYKNHLAGTGAMWTSLNKPVEIIETRATAFTIESDAAKVENEMTFEYAKRFGYDFVRGGGYCQRKPRWPKE